MRRHIHKGREPRELAEYRAKDGAHYDGFPHKDTLREALCKEQGYLCAYCMQRIEPRTTKMKIEHWHAQSSHPNEQLDYQNMLGVCRGGDGMSPSVQHCDTRKGEKEIRINPLRHPERYVKYLFDGSIASDDPAIRGDINVRLNLNVDFLKRNRKAEWDGIFQEFKNKAGDKGFSESMLERAIQRMRERDEDGRYHPYCEFVIYFLEKRRRKVRKPSVTEKPRKVRSKQGRSRR